MLNTGNMEEVIATPMNQQENHGSRGMPASGLPTDLRRENPLMGFAGSNKGSNGSGGIPNPHPQHVNNASNQSDFGHPSYRQFKPKDGDRKPLSQDWGVENQHMEMNKPSFGERKGSANPNFPDFPVPNDNRNRNFKQKVNLSHN